MRAGLLAGAGVAAAAGVGLYGAQVPTAQLYGPTLCRAPGAHGRLALTYDDGPNPAYTPALLELLDRHDAKATFFLIGKWAAREPGLVRELVAAGHAIGNHTQSHPTMPLLGAGGVRDELRRCRDAVEAAGRDALHGRRRGADAPALGAPAAGHAARPPRGGLRPRDVVGHRLRLACPRERRAHRRPLHPRARRRPDPAPRRLAPASRPPTARGRSRRPARRSSTTRPAAPAS